MNPHFTIVGGKIKKKENPESKLRETKQWELKKKFKQKKKKKKKKQTQYVELEKEPTSQNLASILAIDIST